MNNPDRPPVDGPSGSPHDTSAARPAGPDTGAIVAGPAARAAAGTVMGPASGTVAGDLEGSELCSAIDLKRDHDYWHANFLACNYVDGGSSFEDYGPAYDFGANARGRYPGCSFDDVETELSQQWPAGRGASSLSWERARPAAQDAWHRNTLSSKART